MRRASSTRSGPSPTRLRHLRLDPARGRPARRDRGRGRGRHARRSQAATIALTSPRPIRRPRRGVGGLQPVAARAPCSPRRATTRSRSARAHGGPRARSLAVPCACARSTGPPTITPPGARTACCTSKPVGLGRGPAWSRRRRRLRGRVARSLRDDSVGRRHPPARRRRRPGRTAAAPRTRPPACAR